MNRLFNMERRAAMCMACAALALALAPLGCRSKRGPSGPVSTIQMSDAESAAQLAGGFYGVEQGSWRWTKREFSVMLAPPAEAAQKGAWLRLRLTAPPQLIDKVGAVTLSASVNGQPLPPETYSAPGTYTYTREAPGSQLAASPVKVDFQLDKVMPPAGGDLRELGIVVLSVGLEPK